MSKDANNTEAFMNSGSALEPLQARGRAALRSLKFRREAAVYKALQAELEIALEAADRGDPAPLDRWFSQYAVLPTLDTCDGNRVPGRVSHHPDEAELNAKTIEKLREDFQRGLQRIHAPDRQRANIPAPHIDHVVHAAEVAGPEMVGRGTVLPADNSMAERSTAEAPIADLQVVRPSTFEPANRLLETENKARQAEVDSPATESEIAVPVESREEDRRTHESSEPPAGLQDDVMLPAGPDSKPSLQKKPLVKRAVTPPRERRAETKVDPTEHAKTTSAPRGLGTRRRSVPGWLVSSVVHIVLVFVLLTWTIEIAQPESAGIAVAEFVGDEMMLDSSLEMSIEPVEVASPELSVNENSIKPVDATTAMADMSPSSLMDVSPLNGLDKERPTSMSSTLKGALSGGAGSGSVVGSQKISGAQFFGVQAAGNSFVYLVDSSGSMRRDNAFDAAKAELFQSLTSLKPTQRFMVIFFSDAVEQMSLDGKGPEPMPVAATAENLTRVRTWIAGIQIRGGRSPNDAFDVAIAMKPDAIFLLFDGETKVDVAAHLRKVNRVNNLAFGSVPKTSIHTIGFYTQEHEALLKRIADENQGVYRFVPKPLRPFPK